MTDQEWQHLREYWKTQVKDGNLGCSENMIPYAVCRKTKEPYAWVSREYVETIRKKFKTM